MVSWIQCKAFSGNNRDSSFTYLLACCPPPPPPPHTHTHTHKALFPSLPITQSLWWLQLYITKDLEKGVVHKYCIFPHHTSNLLVTFDTNEAQPRNNAFFLSSFLKLRRGGKPHSTVDTYHKTIHQSCPRSHQYHRMHPTGKYSSYCCIYIPKIYRL